MSKKRVNVPYNLNVTNIRPDSSRNADIAATNNMHMLSKASKLPKEERISIQRAYVSNLYKKIQCYSNPNSTGSKSFLHQLLSSSLEKHHQPRVLDSHSNDGRKTKERAPRTESWEIRSVVAREGKRGTAVHQWSQNDKNHQAMRLLSLTLKDKERLHSENSKLMRVAQEVEVLSEKLRIAERIIFKFQLKIDRQNMYMQNLTNDINARVPIEVANKLENQIKSLNATVENYQNKEKRFQDELSKAKVRESELQKSLEMIKELQMAEDLLEEKDLIPDTGFIPPTTSKSKENSRIAEKREKTDDQPEGRMIQPQSQSQRQSQPQSQPQSHPQCQPQPWVSQKEKLRLESMSEQKRSGTAPTKLKQGNLINQKGPKPISTTVTAVDMLQQYIRSLIAENETLKKQLNETRQRDERRQTFPEFVKLRREAIKMRDVERREGEWGRENESDISREACLNCNIL